MTRSPIVAGVITALGVLWLGGSGSSAGRTDDRAIEEGSLTGRAPMKASAAEAWLLRARVTGIVVRDSAGRAMPAPFFGGFDLPRPQLVDIDGDSVPELLVQERSGELMLFRRAGGEWVWETDRFQDIDVGEWYRFADIDGDGKVDLLGEMRTGYIRAWRNEGTRAVPRLVAMGDTVRDVDGLAIVADRQNILNAVDIDCNGRIDLFIGRVQGTVDRYEQEGHSPDGSPRFRLIEEMWQGIEVIGPEGVGGMMPGGMGVPPDTTEHGPSEPAVRSGEERRHGANTLAFADVSGRGGGVLDLFWGDFFEEGLLRFENRGSCAHPDLTGEPERFPKDRPLLTSGYNAPTFGDADGDGIVDMVAGVIGGAFGPYRTSIENLHLVRQAPKGTWTTVTSRLVGGIDVGTEAVPVLADLDGDGLLDLVVGSKISTSDMNTGTITWFRNVGTETEPIFQERGALGIRGEFNYAPAVADLDGDGLPDLVLGTWGGRLQWYRNAGTRGAPSFVLADSALVTIPRGSNATPALGDVDGDGLIDVIVGEAYGRLHFYRNAGTRTAPRFELVDDDFLGIRGARRLAPALADVDGDGRLDLLVGSDAGDVMLWRGLASDSGGVRRFERDESFLLRSYPLSTPTAGMLRGGGRPDIFVGTASGGVRWIEVNRP